MSVLDSIDNQPKEAEGFYSCSRPLMRSRIVALAVIWFFSVSSNGANAEELRFNITAPIGLTNALEPSIRAAAADAIVLKAGIDSVDTRGLLVASLAGDPQAMQTRIDPSNGSVEVLCSDVEALRSRSMQLQLLQELYGPPIVIVEAERPVDPFDLRLAAQVEVALSSFGFHSMNGDAIRKKRRELTDRAVEKGMYPELGRSLLDNQDADFILRVLQARRIISQIESYGIKLSTFEISISITVLRAADQSLIVVLPLIATATSASVISAEKKSEEVIVVDASLAVVGIVAAKWAELASGVLPCLIEIEAPSRAECSEIARMALDRSAVIIENRSGIRCLLELPLPTVDALLREEFFGSVIQRRPGYVLVSRTPQNSGRAAIIFLFVAALSLVFIIWKFSAKRTRFNAD